MAMDTLNQKRNPILAAIAQEYRSSVLTEAFVFSVKTVLAVVGLGAVAGVSAGIALQAVPALMAIAGNAKARLTTESLGALATVLSNPSMLRLLSSTNAFGGLKANAWSNGQVTTASPVGAILARVSDILYKAVSERVGSSDFTLAVGLVNGRFAITVNSGSLSKIQNMEQAVAQVAQRYGVSFLRPVSEGGLIGRLPNGSFGGASHAEQVLYGLTKSPIIGISHSSGPCAWSCRPFFANIPNVEIAFTGIRK